MQILINFLLISFIGGQIFSYGFNNGIRISLLDVSLGVLLIWSILIIRKQVQLVRIFLEYFGGFIAVCILSLLLRIGMLSWQEICISALYLLRFTTYALIYPIFNQLPDKEKKIIIKKLWISGIVIAVLGLMQYFLYPNLRNLAYLGWDPHQFRVFSTFLDPNFTGIILVLTLVLGISLYKKIKPILWYIGQSLCFIALLLTYSRGSFIALGVALLAGVLINRISLIRQIGLIFSFVLLFGILLWLLPKPGGEGVNLLRTISVESRIENNQEAFDLFLKSPVIGWGFNTLRYFRNQTGITPEIISESHSGAGFHNSWLFILATTGIVGLAAYLFIWWKILGIRRIGFIRLIREKQLLIITVLAVFIHSIFDNSLFYPEVMVWLWVICSTIVNIGSDGILHELKIKDKVCI